MMLLRFFLIAFNVGVIGFLIYEVFNVAQQPMERKRKVLFITGAIMLLLAPLGMFFKIFYPSPQYFIVYPVAIFLFLYLTKRIKF